MMLNRTLPRPPLILVPPTTTAATTYMPRALPAVGSPHIERLNMKMPAMAAVMPLST